MKHLLPILVLVMCFEGGLKAQTKEVAPLLARVNAAKTREVKRDICTRVSDSLLEKQKYNTGFKFLQELRKQYATLPTDSFTPDLFNLTGNFYNSTANYNQSIDNFLKAIDLYKKQNRPRGLCNVYTNLGNTYYYLGTYDRALDYYRQAIDLNDREVHDEEVNSNIYNNIGIIYSLRGNYQMGLNFFRKAHLLYASTSDSLSIAYSLNNYSTVHLEQGNLDSAFYYCRESLKLKEKYGTSSDKMDAYNNIADIYFKRGDHDQSLYFLGKTMRLLDTSVYSLSFENAYKLLAQVHEKKNNTSLSYKYFKLAKVIRDTIDAHNKTSELLQREVSIEVSKTHLADSLVAAEDSRVRNLELLQRKKENSFLIISLCIAALIAVLLYNRFRVTRKQKHIIAGQKVLVEQKQKEILDSIHYAKSIQRSLLTSEKYIERTLNRLKEKK